MIPNVVQNNFLIFQTEDHAQPQSKTRLKDTRGVNLTNTDDDNKKPVPFSFGEGLGVLLKPLGQGDFHRG